MSSNEPSSFALDLYFANGEQGDEVMRAHVRACDRCRAYLARLSELSAESRLAHPPPLTASRTRPQRLRRWVGASQLMAAAVAVGALVWLVHPLHYVGDKGVPAVQALVRRDGRAQVWDGRTPIRAGDAIALRTACDRFERVTVLVVGGGAGTTRVFDGLCAGTEGALPFTLVADDRPGDEHITIVFSRARLDEARMAAALKRDERSDDVWVSRLVLSKLGSRP